MDFKDFKNKTWIDWVKILVAIDIACVGFGLVIGKDIHVISHIFGFISRIPMGIIYIFISILMLKRVFPKALSLGDSPETRTHDDDIDDSIRESKNILTDFFNVLHTYANRALQWVDSILDSLALFFEKRHREVKKEISRLLKSSSKSRKNE